MLTADILRANTVRPYKNKREKDLNVGAHIVRPSVCKKIHWLRYNSLRRFPVREL